MDLIVFMGQSNIAGRGGSAGNSVAKLPLQEGAEFRAVSDPTRLFQIEEPFGRAENRPGKIDDGEKKSGSMVSAFVHRYYQLTGRSVLAVSASQGGTSSQLWCETLVEDAAERLKSAVQFCKQQQIPLEHILILWCQGETDGDYGVSAPDYMQNFDFIWNRMQEAGAQHCFLIQIGHFNFRKFPEGLYGIAGKTLDSRYQVIRDAQLQICADREDVDLAASFEGYLEQMRDEFHYQQCAYDEVGAQAAEVCAVWMDNL